MLNEIEIYASTTPFKSGDGKKVLSFQKVIFPVNIENKSCRISCEIVKETIPFSLRKLSMKWAGAIKNMQKVKATVFDTEIDQHLSKNGHYWEADKENSKRVRPFLIWQC